MAGIHTTFEDFVTATSNLDIQFNDSTGEFTLNAQELSSGFAEIIYNESSAEWDIIGGLSAPAQNTEGDFLLRDATGDLFTVQDSDAAKATYHGNGAFTIGYRDEASIGQNSVVIGGLDPSLIPSPSRVESAGGVAIGQNHVINNSFANSAALATVIGYGFEVAANGSSISAIGLGGLSGNVGANCSLDGTRAVSVGYDNTVNGTDAYTFGFNNSLTDNYNYLIGQNLSDAGHNVGEAFIIGRYNDTTLGDFAVFEIGVGETGGELTGLFIERASSRTLTHMNSLSLNISESIDDQRFTAPENAIIDANSSTINQPQFAPIDSIVWNTTFDNAIVSFSNSFGFNTTLTDDGTNMSTGGSVVLWNTTISGLSSGIQLDPNAHIINGTFTESNIELIRDQGASNSITSFSVYSDRLVVHNENSGLRREGCVVLGGGTLDDNGGTVPLNDSVVIGGAIATDQRTIGIGQVTADITDGVVIGGTGGTSVRSNIGGTVSMVFNVQTWDASTGEATVEAFKVLRNARTQIGFDLEILDGSVIYDRRTVSSNQNTTGSSHYSIDTSSGDVTLTILTSENEDGKEINVKNNGSGQVTIETEGASTIDDSTNATISTDNNAVTLIYNSNTDDWEIF